MQTSQPPFPFLRPLSVITCPRPPVPTSLPLCAVLRWLLAYFQQLHCRREPNLSVDLQAGQARNGGIEGAKDGEYVTKKGKKNPVERDGGSALRNWHVGCVSLSNRSDL